MTTLASSRNGTTRIAGRTSHRARPANAPTSIVTPRISSTMRRIAHQAEVERAEVLRIAAMPTTSSAIPSPSQPSGERSRGGRGARGSGGSSTDVGGSAAGGVADWCRGSGRTRRHATGVVPIQQHAEADQQHGPDEPGVELRGDRRGASEQHQHADRRTDAREPPRQPSRGGDADVLARDEDPQQHVGDDRDAEQRPDLPRDHHERQPEQGPHRERAHAEVLGEPAGHPRDHLVRGAPAQRAARRGGGLGRRQLGGHGARWRSVGSAAPGSCPWSSMGTMMAGRLCERHPGCPWKDPEIVPNRAPGRRVARPAAGACDTSGMSPMSSRGCRVPPCAGCSGGAPPTAS